MKIKHSSIKTCRKRMLKEQDNVCPLCLNHIDEDQAVLDHDHDTGHIRTVLHRQCNQAEGRILSWINRTGKHNNPLQFIKQLVKYWEADYSDNHVHPTHKTEKEKQILKLKRKIKSLKTAKGKQKYIKELKELQDK